MDTIGDWKDRLLVRHFLRTRDESSFRKLYKTHTPRLYQTALRLMRRVEADAEEVVQEMWIRAIRGLGDFRWQSTLHTWLTSILIRCCQGTWRDRPPEATSELNGIELSAIPRAELTIGLEAAIAALPERYRAVLILHDLEGYTHEEIAGLLRIEAGTSKSQLHHARRSIRSHLKSERGVSK